MRDINFFEPYKGKKKEKLNFKIYIYGSISIAMLLIIGSFVVNSTRIYFFDKDLSEKPENEKDGHESEIKWYSLSDASTSTR